MSRLAIFLVALMIGGSQACSCYLPQTLEERYCNTQFAILARVTNEVRPESQNNDNDQIFILPFGDVTYTLDVIAIFRDENHPVHLGENFFTTASQSAACGITLQTGSIYFIAGGGGLRLSSCGPIIINLSNGSFQQYLQVQSLVFQSPCPLSPIIQVAEEVQVAA